MTHWATSVPEVGVKSRLPIPTCTYSIKSSVWIRSTRTVRHWRQCTVDEGYGKTRPGRRRFQQCIIIIVVSIDGGGAPRGGGDGSSASDTQHHRRHKITYTPIPVTGGSGGSGSGGAVQAALPTDSRDNGIPGGRAFRTRANTGRVRHFTAGWWRKTGRKNITNPNVFEVLNRFVRHYTLRWFIVVILRSRLLPSTHVLLLLRRRRFYR